MNNNDMEAMLRCLRDAEPIIDDDMMAQLKQLALDAYSAPAVPQCPPRKTDEQLRRECPAVKDAYDQYKMMLELARTDDGSEDKPKVLSPLQQAIKDRTL